MSAAEPLAAVLLCGESNLMPNKKPLLKEEASANLIARDGTFTRPRFSLGKILENI